MFDRSKLDNDGKDRLIEVLRKAATSESYILIYITPHRLTTSTLTGALEWSCAPRL